MVFDREFTLTFAVGFQADTHLACSIRIGILECVRDPFIQDDAEAHAGVGVELVRLERRAKRRAIALRPHGNLQLLKQARQIIIERDEPHVT